MAHFTEYAILCFLFFRSWCYTAHEGIELSWKMRWAIYSVLMSIATAFFDEFHQSFVPSRTSSLRDVALDTAGALFTFFIIRVWLTTKPRTAERV